MKHNTSNRRMRPRSGKPRHNSGGGSRNNFESNGPEGRVRGSAQQVLDKYLALARDAQSAGDRINSESFSQYAEHYYRVLNADAANNNHSRRDQQQPELLAQVEQPTAAATSETQPLSSDVRQGVAGEVQAKMDLAEQPQPDIADVIPPAIDVSGADQAEPAPKPRRRGSQDKAEVPSEETETIQVS